MHCRQGRCCGVFVWWAVLSFLAVGAGNRGVAQEQQPGGTARSRQLAPGALIEIPKSVDPGDMAIGPVALPEITIGIPDLDWTPHFESPSRTLLGQAKTVTFYHPVWCLSFAFKPMRMIDVDIPLPSGEVQRKRIWYLVYRVKNMGYDLNPQLREAIPELKTAEPEEVNYPTRVFFPHFVLESHEFNKQYLDRIIPAAKAPIEARERPGVPLYNSTNMSTVRIPLSTDEGDPGVWGYATWEDLDPRMDFFSVYVRGLTNASQYEDVPGAFKAGDPPTTGRKFTFKTLQLNFWRPGDTEFEHEAEVRFGVPIDNDPARQREFLSKYGLERRLDYLWVYR